jgi:hypothetical protein
MPDREYHDLPCSVIDHVINEIAVPGRHELADAIDILRPADRGKKSQILERAQYCISHPPEVVSLGVV